MNSIGRFLKYLFWAAVASWTVSLLRRLVDHMGADYAPSNQTVDVTNEVVSKRLVRDPVCGLHIAEGRALPLHQGNEIFYFCSAECRDKYVSEQHRFAANA